MGTRGVKVGLTGIGVIMLGMRGIRVGMRGISMILRENVHVYCFG